MGVFFWWIKNRIYERIILIFELFRSEKNHKFSLGKLRTRDSDAGDRKVCLHGNSKLEKEWEI